MNNYARITITLSTAEYLSLVDSAKQEIRPPRDHARFLLRKALGIASNEPLSSNNTPPGSIIQSELQHG